MLFGKGLRHLSYISSGNLLLTFALFFRYSSCNEKRGTFNPLYTITTHRRWKILPPKSHYLDISLKFTRLAIREIMYSRSIHCTGKSQWCDFVFEKTDVKNKQIGSNKPTMQKTWISYNISFTCDTVISIFQTKECQGVFQPFWGKSVFCQLLS